MGFLKECLNKIWRVLSVILLLMGCFCIYQVFSDAEGYNIIANYLRFMFAGSFIGIVIAIEILRIGYGRKCPSCKKWFALKKCGTEFVEEQNISVKVVGNTYNRNRDVIGTQEQYVPGIRRIYHKNYKCKICGKECYTTFSKDRALL